MEVQNLCWIEADLMCSTSSEAITKTTKPFIEDYLQVTNNTDIAGP